MDRGERLNKLGDSWFSSKSIEVLRRVINIGGRDTEWLRGLTGLPTPTKLRIPVFVSRQKECEG